MVNPSPHSRGCGLTPYNNRSWLGIASVEYFRTVCSIIVSRYSKEISHQAYGAACVLAVAIRANLFGILHGDGSAANKYLHLGAQPRGLQCLDGCLHGWHGHRQQRRHADNLRLPLLNRGHKLLRRNIGAEIDHLESAAFEHGSHDVLADVVQVAL